MAVVFKHLSHLSAPSLPKNILWFDSQFAVRAAPSLFVWSLEVTKSVDELWKSQPQDETICGIWLPLLEIQGNDMRWRQRSSEIIPWLVLRLSGSEVVLQKGLQVLEGGPLLGVLLPALHHQLVQGRGAVLRARHPVASLHLLQHLAVVHAYRHRERSSGWQPLTASFISSFFVLGLDKVSATLYKQQSSRVI